jgi:hypothetical protein
MKKKKPTAEEIRATEITKNVSDYLHCSNGVRYRMLTEPRWKIISQLRTNDWEYTLSILLKTGTDLQYFQGSPKWIKIQQDI